MKIVEMNEKVTVSTQLQQQDVGAVIQIITKDMGFSRGNREKSHARSHISTTSSGNCW
jgi:protein tyrosine phosphatase (PTP) superfamily phosphohydrolase (DUF442 family)